MREGGSEGGKERGREGDISLKEEAPGRTNIEQEVAVLRDNVDEGGDQLLRRDVVLHALLLVVPEAKPDPPAPFPPV